MRRPGWPTVFFNPGWIGLSHPYVPYKVVRHHLDGQPGAVGGEAPRGQMVQPDAVLEVSDGILDLGVAAVVGRQCQGLPLPVGDAAVIAVAGEEGQLGAGRGLDLRTMSRTGAASGLLSKRTYVVSATSAAPSI